MAGFARLGGPGDQGPLARPGRRAGRGPGAPAAGVTGPGDRRAAARQRADRRIDGDFRALERSGFNAGDDPVTHFRIDQDRPDALERRDRHRRAGHAERQARLRAAVVVGRRSGDAEFAVADVALRHQDAPPCRIEADAHGNAVENQRRFGLLLLSGKQHGAAAQAELPVGHGIAGRLEMRQQREAVAARLGLERRQQHAARGVPIDIDVDPIDRHRKVGNLSIDNRASVDLHFSCQIRRQAVAADLAAQPSRDRQIDVVMAVRHPHRDHDVLCRDAVGHHVDSANTISLRPDAGAQQPRLLGVGTDAQRKAARTRTAQIHGDVLERPAMSRLLIVDHQRAVFQTDLAEIVTVHPAGAESVDPGQCGGKILADCGRRRRRGQAVTIGFRGGWQSRRRRRNDRWLARYDGARAGAGGNADAAVTLDAHRQFGVDQAEALGAQPSRQQRRHRQTNLRLRRARHHNAVAVANDDVEHAHRNADTAGALDLGAADFDRMIVTEIGLDGAGQPRRRHVDSDRPFAEPPPQQAESDRGQQADDKPPGYHTLDPGMIAEPAGQSRELVSPAGEQRLGPVQKTARTVAGEVVLSDVVIIVDPVRRGCVSLPGCVMSRLPADHTAVNVLLAAARFQDACCQRNGRRRGIASPPSRCSTEATTPVARAADFRHHTPPDDTSCADGRPHRSPQKQALLRPRKRRKEGVCPRNRPRNPAHPRRN